jgi:hypothetical protein
LSSFAATDRAELSRNVSIEVYRGSRFHPNLRHIATSEEPDRRRMRQCAEPGQGTARYAEVFTWELHSLRERGML